MQSGVPNPDYSSLTISRLALVLSLASTAAYFLTSEGVRNYLRWVSATLQRLLRFLAR